MLDKALKLSLCAIVGLAVALSGGCARSTSPLSGGPTTSPSTSAFPTASLLAPSSDPRLLTAIPVVGSLDIDGNVSLTAPPSSFSSTKVEPSLLLSEMAGLSQEVKHWEDVSKSQTLTYGVLHTVDQPRGTVVFAYLRLADGPVCSGTIGPSGPPTGTKMALPEPYSAPCKVGILYPLSAGADPIVIQGVY